MTTKVVELNLCCALSVATQASPIFKDKRLHCGDCGREMVYPDDGTGWKYAATPQQPAPEAGEWCHGDNGSLLDRRRIYNGDNRHIATALSDDDAIEIIHNHHLASLVPQLVDTLGLVRQLLTNQTTCERSLCEGCDTGRRTVLQAVDFALNTTSKGAGEG